MWFGGGMISARTFVRHFSRQRAENLRKINPKVTTQEASSIAQQVYHVIKQNGPLTVSNAWVQAQIQAWLRSSLTECLKDGFSFNYTVIDNVSFSILQPVELFMTLGSTAART
ncbi:hypothetical protein CJ030_MR5G015888 [Morella rubra]|uniref:Uncharacterized protein n=1 Tax=Morella rubra TaxID=262757 RepID=A0A6A1VK50_9ROSI|nr:hypothetical protein CJ030_MR5G015888 [Morella rubra]